MKTNPTLTSSELFSEIIDHWLFLLLIALSGAIVSFLIASFIIKPVYISSSQISVGINFKEIGHISQYDQDQYIGLVEALFLSDDVMESTLQSLQSDQIVLSKEEFVNNRSVERKANLIILKYTSQDQTLPQIIVTTWAQNAFDKLSDSYEHALKYQTFVDFQNSYLRCIENSVILPAPSLCESISNQLPSSETIMEEKFLSNGLFPGLTFYLVNQEGSVPQVTRFHTNNLVLAGFFIGFILALIKILLVKKRPSTNEKPNP
ncbi:MAG: hypothetical protein CL609_06810 [Anaerolineaceae bacterium]|nr:hypothetical protein [Anaerolineaceae bacterium]